MPAVNFILANWEEQKKIFFYNLNLLGKKPEPEAVHDLRIAVKKLRSYLRLLEKVSGTEWKTPFTALDYLFKTLGTHRDVEMSLSLLKKHPYTQAETLLYFKQYLLAQHTLTRRWTKSAARKFNKDSFQSLNQLMASFSFFTNEELTFLIRQYSREKMDRAVKLARNFVAEAHEIRKLLKDLYYWIRMSPPEAQPPLQHVKKLEKLLATLGHSQDHFLFKEKLKLFRKDLVPGKHPPYEAIKKLEQKSTHRQNYFLSLAKNNFQFLEDNFYMP